MLTSPQWLRRQEMQLALSYVPDTVNIDRLYDSGMHVSEHNNLS